ncbi:Uncharacterised protein [Candidatus Gugararchaeum adminiculabundum]|nr:Uncharacterised protein [Candidatus Gugararchaeum adminiculabundum]
MRVVVYNYAPPNESEKFQFVSSGEANGEIDRADNILSELESLVSIASSLGLSGDYSSVQATLSTAKASYAAGNYSMAKSAATSAYSDAFQKKSQFVNLLNSKLLTMLSEDRSRLEAARVKIEKFDLNISLNLTSEYLANASKHIADSDYRNAIGALGKADMRLKLIEAVNVSEPTIVPPDLSNFPFASDVKELSDKKAELIAKASEYKQEINTADFDQLITLAANPSTPASQAIAALADARVRILTIEKDLNAKIVKIDSAKEKIADSQKAIDETTATRNLLASADAKAALLTLDQAKSSLYDDPVRSAELADQAKALAAAEKKRVNEVGATIPLFIGGFAAIIVIAAAGVYIYLRQKSKRRRGL